jgi:hypothetical protein
MTAAARPRGHVDVQVAITAANLQPAARREGRQRSLHQEMTAPVEAQQVKVDNRQR